MAKPRGATRSPQTAAPPSKPTQVSLATSPQEKLAEIAELLPGSRPVVERVRQVVQQVHHQGPIPHPEVFKGYGEVVKDAPERILRVFEQDSAHAREIQSAALNAQKEDNRRVHWMAWSLVAGGYVLSAVFAYLNKDILAWTILATTLAGTITGFLQGRKPAQDPSKKE